MGLARGLGARRKGEGENERHERRWEAGTRRYQGLARRCAAWQRLPLPYGRGSLSRLATLAAVSKKPSSSPSEPGEPVSFEQSLAEVEAIIRRVETGEVGLEESIVQYERGVALIRQCRETLDRAEQRVVDLTAQMQAQIPGQTQREGGASADRAE